MILYIHLPSYKQAVPAPVSVEKTEGEHLCLSWHTVRFNIQVFLNLPQRGRLVLSLLHLLPFFFKIYGTKCFFLLLVVAHYWALTHIAEYN